MREYKRLTKQAGWHKDIDLKDELGYSYIYQRLAELENAIEQRTLIELPCKVGDTVYVIPHIWDMKGKFVGDIDKRKADAFYVIGDFVDIEDDILGEFYRVGVEVFFTPEEAEKRLKELQK